MSALRIPADVVRPALTAARIALGAPVPPVVHRVVSRVAGVTAGRLAGIGAERATVGGVRGEWIRAERAHEDRAVLFLHGGGYAVGCPELYRVALSRLAERLSARVFAADYRQAPECPHPAALDDARAAYAALRTELAGLAQVMIVGDSAGGGLALALAMAARDEGLAPPAALGLICPWLDLTQAGATQRTQDRKDALLRPAMLERWARSHAGSRREDPAVSPLYGDLTGLPPIVLHSTGDDLLLADAERLECLARLAGAPLVHRRHPRLWHDVHLFAGLVRDADAALDGLAGDLLVAAGLAPSPPRVAIIGAGVSGLAMAHTLRDRGLHDFTLYEKAEEVGGTWRENRYPGLTCDVPANFYSFSFAPNPGWTSSFAPGPEIQAYIGDTFAREGLLPHIDFGQDIEEATWDGGRWLLRSAGGDTHEAEVLITATGVLHHPVIPDLPGLGDFAGACFHSARWEHDVPLDDARVAVIGNGSTGVQIVGALGGRTRSLLLFQRTAQWIAPVGNVRYPAGLRWAMGHVPGLNRAAYVGYQRALEALLPPAIARDGWQRRLLATACERNLRHAVRDPELRERLRPDHTPLCKRLIMSASFYPALQRPGVELVDAGIDHVQANGIVTADGELHEADVIVLATGFDAHAYMRPMRITGREGLTLDEAWADGPRGYNTVALSGFPNLFTVMGPHSPVGNHSIIAVAETQAAYIAQCVQALRDDAGLESLEPRADATDAFNDALRADLPGTVWASGCRSWYLDEDGVPQLWPWSPARHRRLLARPDLGEFHHAASAARAASGA